MLRKWKRADVDDKGENNNNAERQRKGRGSKVIMGSNYGPITCLPFVWKLPTCVIAKEIFGYKFVITSRTKRILAKI